VDIINDKIWIQNDNLEYSVAERLVDRGIAKKDIVLAYFSPSHRAFTEYASIIFFHKKAFLYNGKAFFMEILRGYHFILSLNALKYIYQMCEKQIAALFH
jgi:XisI protein